jgi:hypothetical protein
MVSLLSPVRIFNASEAVNLSTTGSIQTDQALPDVNIFYLADTLEVSLEVEYCFNIAKQVDKIFGAENCLDLRIIKFNNI